MTGTAVRTSIATPDPVENDEAVYLVDPPARINAVETTPYVLVTSSPAAGDTQVLPCSAEGFVLNLVLLGRVRPMDHAVALRAAGWEPEEVPHVA
ncbi:hypothetical protein [Streptomyces sp. NPDC055990]|uniref:hypothetical protein n=1 Tax=Streptomyces sp. NPDC055990 TaxID=3345672 RepID=UPI0035DDA6F7